MESESTMKRLTFCFGQLTLAIILLAPLACARRGQPDEPAVKKTEWAQYFKEYGVTGAGAVYDEAAGQWLRYNPRGCGAERLPASTFKILNSLIALETGVAPDENLQIKWDGTDTGIRAWNRDQTMRSAFKASVVWYYQELARRIGMQRMQEWVGKAGYGNAVAGPAVDSFWLTGDLRISPNEQVEFLRKLYHDQLPFSKRSMAIVKDLMLQEGTKTYGLFGKTGWAVGSKENIGWFVGWVERKNRKPVFFATCIESKQPGRDFGPARTEITKCILREMGVME